MAGVLTLYHADADAFTRDHLRILQAISSKAGIALENALKYRQVENSSVTRTFDYESCLLGMVNVDLDPSGEMNVWLSSASSHPWNLSLIHI